MRSDKWLVAVSILALPGVLLAPAWRIAGLGAGEDDVLYYLPSRTFFHETVGAGQPPWWNRWTGCGRPFMADPQTAVWYPPTWLFASLPPLVAYPLSLWLHYSLATWGAYRLLRGYSLGRRAALFGGVAFAFCGFMVAHRVHFTMQHAAAWTPWVFWRVERFVLAPERRAGRLASAVTVAALQCFAGHFQIAALSGLGLAVYLLARVGLRAARVGLRTALGRFALVWTLAICVFSVQLLPTIAYVTHTTRTARGYLDFVENSWSPVAAIGLVLPLLLGQRVPNFFDQSWWGPSHQCEQLVYAGIIPLLLAGVALRVGWRADPRRAGWFLLLAFAVLLALGMYGPVCPLLYWLPGSSLFRVPARGLVLAQLAVAVLAAFTLDDLAAPLTPYRARLRAALLGWSAQPLRAACVLLGVPLVLAGAALPFLPMETRRAALAALWPANPALWVPVLLVTASVFVLRSATRRWRQPAFLWSLLIVTGVDLGLVGWSIDVPRGVGAASELIAPGPSADWLDRVRTSGARLWVVTGRGSDGKPGEYRDSLRKSVANANILYHVTALTDYGPLQPVAFARRFGFAPWGETTRAAELLRDDAWMSRFGVGWVLICDAPTPAPSSGRLTCITDEGWRLYQMPDPPAAWIESDAGTSGLSPRVVWASSSRLEVRIATASAGPAPNAARLVLPITALPGWSATADGEPADVAPTADGLLSVRVNGAATSVVLRYAPPMLWPGVAAALAGIAITLVLSRWY